MTEISPKKHAKYRVWALVLYFLSILSLQHFIIQGGINPGDKSIWIFSACASLLFGSQILNPHFTPAAGAAANAYVAAITLFPALIAPDNFAIYVALSLNILLGIFSILVLSLRPTTEIEKKRFR